MSGIYPRPAGSSYDRLAPGNLLSTLALLPILLGAAQDNGARAARDLVEKLRSGRVEVAGFHALTSAPEGDTL